MPAGNEIGTFEATYTSVRTLEIHGDQRVIEGSYMGKISGQMVGTVSGTTTFSGSNERGSISDKSVGYLDSGDVLSAEGCGVYWSGANASWQTRVALLVGDQKIVGEGRLALSDGVFSMSGKMFELT